MSYGNVEQRLAGIEKELHQTNKILANLLRVLNQPKPETKKNGILCPICGFPLNRKGESNCITCPACGCDIYLV